MKQAPLHPFRRAIAAPVVIRWRPWQYLTWRCSIVPAKHAQLSYAQYFFASLPMISPRKVLFSIVAEDIAQHALNSSYNRELVQILQDKLTHVSKSLEPELAKRTQLSQVMQKILQDIYEEELISSGNLIAVSVMIAAVYCDSSNGHVKLALFHIGYSRAFLIRAHKLYPLTLPHTQAVESYQQGALALEEFSLHPSNQIPKRWIGQAGRINADTRIISLEADFLESVRPQNEPIRLAQGDTILLCTSLLAEILSEQEIVAFVTNRRPSKAIKQLIAAVEKREMTAGRELQAVILAWPTTGQSVKYSLLNFVSLIGLFIRLIIIVLCVILSANALSALSNLGSGVATTPTATPTASAAELSHTPESFAQPTSTLPVGFSSPEATPLQLGSQAPSQQAVVESTGIAPTVVPTATVTPTTTVRSAAFIPPVILPNFTKLAAINQPVVTFAWQWEGELEDGQGFDVLVWQSNSAHNSLQDVREYNNGERIKRENNHYHVTLPIPSQTGSYRWAVVVIQIDPYARISPESNVGELTIDLSCRSTIPCRPN